MNERIELIDWLIACLLACLIDWLIEWLNDWMIEWLTDWLIDWLIEWMNEWMIDWLIDGLIDCLIDWLIEWMNEWMNECWIVNMKCTTSVCTMYDMYDMHANLFFFKWTCDELAWVINFSSWQHYNWSEVLVVYRWIDPAVKHTNMGDVFRYLFNTIYNRTDDVSRNRDRLSIHYNV